MKLILNVGLFCDDHDQALEGYKVLKRAYQSCCCLKAARNRIRPHLDGDIGAQNPIRWIRPVSSSCEQSSIVHTKYSTRMTCSIDTTELSWVLRGRSGYTIRASRDVDARLRHVLYHFWAQSERCLTKSAFGAAEYKEIRTVVLLAGCSLPGQAATLVIACPS